MGSGKTGAKPPAPVSVTPIQKERLLAICPIDGRYKSKVEGMSKYFSELALIKYRVQVELAWFKTLLKNKHVALQEVSLGATDTALLERIVSEFSPEDAERVKQIESVTNHDMKAVEYFLKEKFKDSPQLSSLGEYIHFTCTSEDISNLAYGLIVQEGFVQELKPKLEKVIKVLQRMSKDMANAPMMGHTHGQAATPTTMGKELANFVYRLQGCLNELKDFRASGKFNGAVGNFNAHLVACPEADWPSISKAFVESLGLKWNPYSTQIEPHDSMVKLFGVLERMNTIMLGMSRDIWMYTSAGYFKMKVVKGEVGSSTMPHKVNPIHFENAEGNLGLANAVLAHFGNKLPISRMQRDLSDSTVLRNIGVAFAYSSIGYASLLTGLSRLDINREDMLSELDSHYELLGEAVQTVMRRYKKEAPYEQLKEFTRGKQVNQTDYINFIEHLDLPAHEKNKLKALKPSLYLGLAQQLAHDLANYI
jgi:adenylosuccinate lyase